LRLRDDVYNEVSKGAGRRKQLALSIFYHIRLLATDYFFLSEQAATHPEKDRCDSIAPSIHFAVTIIDVIVKAVIVKACNRHRFRVTKNLNPGRRAKASRADGSPSQSLSTQVDEFRSFRQSPTHPGRHGGSALSRSGVCTAWQFQERRFPPMRPFVPGVSGAKSSRHQLQLHDTHNPLLKESTIQSAPWHGSSFQRLLSGGSRILLQLQLSAQIDGRRTDRWTDHRTDHRTDRSTIGSVDQIGRSDQSDCFDNAAAAGKANRRFLLPLILNGPAGKKNRRSGSPSEPFRRGAWWPAARSTVPGRR
jgi:hypothetical protein